MSKWGLGPWKNGGSGIPYYRENEDPRSTFSWECGDPSVKTETPSMADDFPRSTRTISMADHNHRNMAIPSPKHCSIPLCSLVEESS